MKKTSTVRVNANMIFKGHKLTIGLDLGDRWSFYCVLDEAGQIILEQKLPTTPEAMKQTFGKISRSLIALETGTHSPWVSRLLRELGHEVLVAHAQKVQLISKSNRKDDRHDARTLARLARIDPELLGPVRHRSAKAQIHLTVIRARAELVRARTALVNAARGLVKSSGQRLPKCGTEQVSRELATGLNAELREVLEPLLKEIESLNERIQEYDARMEKIARESYPQVELLKQVKGVGTQIALTYVLTLEDPHRFPKSREVGCFLGLRPGRRDLGTFRMLSRDSANCMRSYSGMSSLCRFSSPSAPAIATCELRSAVCKRPQLYMCRNGKQCVEGNSHLHALAIHLEAIHLNDTCSGGGYGAVVHQTRWPTVTYRA
jgi:transposase